MKNIFIFSVYTLFSMTSFAQALIANPSSVLCEDLGGHSQVLNTDEGQIGICAFGAAAIEEWTLFRQKNGTITGVVHAYFNPKLVNPVIVNPRGKAIAQPGVTYCGLQGGAIKKATNSTGQVVELCQFEDGSSMTKVTFYRGAGHPENAVLTSVLKERY